MAAWMRPSHRNTDDLQPEVCDVCGNLVGQSHLIESEVEGLRGRVVCDLHRFERKMAVTPTYNDLRALNPPPYAPDAGKRLQPIGAPLWFVDPGEEEA